MAVAVGVDSFALESSALAGRLTGWSESVALPVDVGNSSPPIA